MLELNLKQISEANFHRAMMRLLNNPKLEQKASYRVGRICQAIDREMKKVEPALGELEKKYSKKDENGAVIEPKSWIDEASYEAFNKEREALFEAHKFNVLVHKLPYQAICEVDNFTGLDRISIESIVDGIPEEI